MMFAKLQIEGQMKVETGLHIGASSAFAAIGATDSPVIKDSYTNLPMIPASSLKGKMRSLLVKAYNEELASNPNQDSEKIRRLFGDSEDIKSGRLIFRDTILANSEELQTHGAQTLTEVKFENTIDRKNGQATPRQIERVIPGSIFPIEIIYELTNEEELLEDLQLILDGLKLLELDYLGGHGSRGYGRVSFEDLNLEAVFGDVDSQILNEAKAKLEDF